jgi:hypothetical protein
MNVKKVFAAVFLVAILAASLFAIGTPKKYEPVLGRAITEPSNGQKVFMKSRLATAEEECGGCWGPDETCAQCHMQCDYYPGTYPWGDCINCANWNQLCRDMPWGNLTSKSGRVLKMNLNWAKQKMPSDHTVKAAAVTINEIRCQIRKPSVVRAVK